MTMRALVYGGQGALGSVCIKQLKASGYWICSVDFTPNEQADSNVLVAKANTLEEQTTQVLTAVQSALGDSKLGGIFCVAGGWAGGNATDDDFIKNCELTWKQSVWTSCIATSIAAKYLDLQDMIGYGMAKAAVHQMVKSLACPTGGLPKQGCVTAILPITLDTPMNRKFMPKGDFSTWTPLELVADRFVKWLQNENRPTSGTLLQLITKNGETLFKAE